MKPCVIFLVGSQSWIVADKTVSSSDYKSENYAYIVKKKNIVKPAEVCLL